MSFKTSKMIVVKGNKKKKEKKRRHSKSYRSKDKLHLCLIRHSFFFFFFVFLLNRKQTEEKYFKYIHTQVSVPSYLSENNVILCKIRKCPWWLITTTSSVCIHVYSIDMRKHVSAIRTTTREKIMNYQWERKRDQRVVTDDTRVLMRQTVIPGARLLLILALVCCARAQLLVLTLNHVLFLVGHDFLPSLPLLAFFLCLCVCVHVRACAA